MRLDPHTPVVIGAGVVSNRTNAGAAVREPIALLADAVRLAAEDADAASGAPAVLEAVRLARCAPVLTNRHADPAGLTAAALGLQGVRSELWMGGGEVCGTMLADTAGAIGAGSGGVTALLAGEAWYSKVAAARGRGPGLPRVDDDASPAPDRVAGGLIEFVHPAEEAIGLTDPIALYPLLEQALRVASGRTPAEHRSWLGELWAGFSEVASSNPWAWDRTAHSADEIATPSPANRLVGSPYTKLMVSNEQVDQGAALLVCSVAEAERLGVPRDRWVFPWLTVEGAAPTMTARVDLSRSSLAEVVGRTLWDASGLGADDVGPVDLYSCFPSAVQQQAAGYGLSLDRPLTVTGGMRFAGGPWNGYPMHGMARMVHVLREDPGAVGLCSANGGVVTKLAATVFSTRPPDRAFSHRRPDDELAAVARRRPAVPGPGDDLEGAIETWTVMHDRRGTPTHGFVAVTPDDEHRCWGRVEEAEDLAALNGDEEQVGRRVRISGDGLVRLTG